MLHNDSHRHVHASKRIVSERTSRHPSIARDKRSRVNHLMEMVFFDVILDAGRKSCSLLPVGTDPL
jgi:hypothetical protein